MTRPTFAETQLLVDSLLADNTAGAITPADVRQVFDAVTALFQPASTGLTGVTGATIALTTADTPLTIFDTPLPELGEQGVIVPSVANDNIVSSLVGVHRFDFTTSIEGPNNDDVIVTLYRNGVATVVASEISLRGAGNRVEFTMSFPLQGPAPGPNTYSLRARLRSGSGSVTFNNSVFVLGFIPGQ
jgi:hypothetical protein